MNKGKTRPLPQLARLNELLTLDHKTGELTWKVKASGITFGSRAGTLNRSTGYRNIRIDGIDYREHRVIYFMATGDDPGSLHIDHIDTYRSTNRPANLQVVTSQANNQAQTAQTNNSSGFTGVSFYKPSNKWEVKINVDGKKRHLGYFVNFDEACTARIKAELNLFTIQPRREGAQLELYERLQATESAVESV